MSETESLWTTGERKLLEEGIIPSPNSVDCARSALSDYMQRLASTQPHVAEVYHENSKLSPCSTLEVPMDGRKLAEVRSWFFQTAYAMREDEIEPRYEADFRSRVDRLPEPLSSLLTPFTAPGPAANLLYSVDLLLLHQARIYRLVATTPKLWVEREVAPNEWIALSAALPALPASCRLEHTPLLFLIGCAWRYMLVYGPRGYRYTLFDAGRLLSLLESQAAKARCGLFLMQEFYDSRLDRFLYAEGVERSTLAVLALSGGQP